MLKETKEENSIIGRQHWGRRLKGLEDLPKQHNTCNQMLYPFAFCFLYYSSIGDDELSL
jgi:hypothetical protein